MDDRNVIKNVLKNYPFYVCLRKYFIFKEETVVSLILWESFTSPF